ncbi:MAG TPA: hypothetical protein VHT73_14485 [Thermodesulfobacteriota bacterium]|nr:hypothetical protein [Thermodesulfobacteriota bacterium]
MSRNSEYEEVLKVNQKFYDALGTRDLELMDAVWVKGARPGCVHPGWIMLRGWEAINYISHPIQLRRTIPLRRQRPLRKRLRTGSLRTVQQM